MRLGSNSVIRETLSIQTLTRPMRAALQENIATEVQAQSYLLEALSGIATVKASGAEERALDHWTDRFFADLRVTLRRNQLFATIELILSSLRMLSPLALLWVGVNRVLDGSMSLGSMLALNALAAAFLLALATLTTNGQRLQLVGTHLERVADVLLAEPEQDRQTVRSAPRLLGHIELRNVSFSHDPGGSGTLRDAPRHLGHPRTRSKDRTRGPDRVGQYNAGHAPARALPAIGG
jgi:ATP-binding cassette subfamily B protein